MVTVNDAIARTLYIDVRGVEKHIGNIYLALGLWPIDPDINRRVIAALAYRAAYSD
jgi:DNA-binding NarL/FixJ family response regulator